MQMLRLMHKMPTAAAQAYLLCVSHEQMYARKPTCRRLSSHQGKAIDDSPETATAAGAFLMGSGGRADQPSVMPEGRPARQSRPWQHSSASVNEAMVEPGQGRGGVNETWSKRVAGAVAR